ncbi:MAG: hypothetical protein AAF391_05380 [Bacteroidota bacterium]
MVGLWEVLSVNVGDQTMTPVARWFQYNEDGTCTGGNGWTQNSVGTWTYDPKTKQFSAENSNGVKDEYGSFDVKFDQNKMMWNRKEDGMEVVVVLKPIEEVSPAPADLVHGLWRLTNVTKVGVNVTSSFDPQSKQFIHIRPDKRFRLRNRDETLIAGFWHMNGHRPLFTLINDDRSIANESFSVEFKDSQLIMKKSGEDVTFVYQRIFQFPN